MRTVQSLMNLDLKESKKIKLLDDRQERYINHRDIQLENPEMWEECRIKFHLFFSCFPLPTGSCYDSVESTLILDMLSTGECHVEKEHGLTV